MAWEEIQFNLLQTFFISYTYSARQQEEVKKIREKYLPAEEDKMEQLRRLDESAVRPGTVASIILGVIGALLLGVGMCFEFKTLRKNARALGASVLCKLVLLPVVMCLLGVWWFGFCDAELMITLIAFGAPTAVSSYTMAQMYDVDHDLANQEVVATTLGCIVTLAALIWAFTQTPFLTL